MVSIPQQRFLTIINVLSSLLTCGPTATQMRVVRTFRSNGSKVSDYHADALAVVEYT